VYTYRTAGQVLITSDGGGGTVTLVVSWPDGVSRVPASDPPVTVTVPKGQTSTYVSISHTFASTAALYGVQAVIPVQGFNSYKQLATYQCNPPR
jgi:hypothetical protein